MAVIFFRGIVKPCAIVVGQKQIFIFFRLEN